MKIIGARTTAVRFVATTGSSKEVASLEHLPARVLLGMSFAPGQVWPVWSGQDGERAMGGQDQGVHFAFRDLRTDPASEMPVNAAARIVGEHDTRLWRLLEAYVNKAYQRQTSAIWVCSLR